MSAAFLLQINPSLRPRYRSAMVASGVSTLIDLYMSGLRGPRSPTRQQRLDFWPSLRLASSPSPISTGTRIAWPVRSTRLAHRHGLHFAGTDALDQKIMRAKSKPARHPPTLNLLQIRARRGLCFVGHQAAASRQRAGRLQSPEQRLGAPTRSPRFLDEDERESAACRVSQERIRQALHAGVDGDHVRCAQVGATATALVRRRHGAGARPRCTRARTAAARAAAIAGRDRPARRFEGGPMTLVFGSRDIRVGRTASAPVGTRRCGPRGSGAFASTICGYSAQAISRKRTSTC